VFSFLLGALPRTWCAPDHARGTERAAKCLDPATAPSTGSRPVFDTAGKVVPEISGNLSGRSICRYTELSKVTHGSFISFVGFTKTEPVAAGQCVKLPT